MLDEKAYSYLELWRIVAQAKCVASMQEKDKSLLAYCESSPEEYCTCLAEVLSEGKTMAELRIIDQNYSSDQAIQRNVMDTQVVCLARLQKKQRPAKAQ